METRFKIIETESYLIATSTKDFETNYYYNEFDKALRIGTVRQPYHKSVVGYYSKDNSIELDLPLLPLFSEIVVEDDIEKLAKDLWKKEYKDLESSRMKRLFISAYTQGYKSATKVYSEEDLKKAYNKGFSEGVIKGTCSMVYKHESFEEYIQFLKQSKTTLKWFVAEMEQVILKDPNSCEHYIEVGCIKDICTCYTFRLKTTTINNKTYLVGHYE
jgi:hypothetical protein